MKNKKIIIIIAIVFLLCFACGIIGFLNKDKNVSTKNVIKITYEYYLDDVKQDIMPQNNSTDEENSYTYLRHSCTNNLTGKFDVENWKFIPNDNKESTCSIYFAKSSYEVTLTITNAIEDEENNKYVKRGEDGTFKIKPEEGYKFSSSTCSSNKEAKWDESTSSLLISDITSDIACTVLFNLKELNVKLNIVNGKTSITETKKYGEQFSALVEPNSGYEYNKNKTTLKCTNNQNAIYENGNVVIDKITNNTECTLTFNKIEEKKYVLKIKDLSNNINIVSGAAEQKIQQGNTGSFTLLANSGYQIEKIDCGGVIPTIETNEDTSITYKFLGISKDITCTIIEKQLTETETENENENE